MIPNLFFDLSSPESATGFFSVATGVSSAATGVSSAAAGVSSAATGASSAATATDSSGSSFSEVINDIHNDPQVTEINNKNEHGYEAPDDRDGHLPGSVESEAPGATTARVVNTSAGQNPEFEGDRAVLPAPADPKFSSSNPSEPTGNQLLPTGNRLPAAGQSLPSVERLNNPFGSDAVSVAYARQLDRQALTAASAASTPVAHANPSGADIDGAEVVATARESQKTHAGDALINGAQAPKLIRTRVAVAGASGQPAPASSMPMALPEALNEFAGSNQTTAARFDISAAAVAAAAAARTRGEETTTGGVSAELTAGSTSARATEEQGRDGLTPRDSLSRKQRNVHVEAERFWRNAAQIQGDSTRELSLSRTAHPSPVASAIAAMNMQPSAELAAGTLSHSMLNAPGVHSKSANQADGRLQLSGSHVANPAAMTLDTLDAQRLDVTAAKPELQMALADRPPAAPGVWQPPANAVENRFSSSRSNRSLAAAAAISGAEQTIADSSNAATLVGTDATRAENTWLRAEFNGQSQQLGQQVARQILFAHNQNLSQMRMQLNPEELGQLDLRLRIEGDRVHVAIVAQHNGAREILEAQLPQLRSLLEEGGFELGDVDVRHQGGDGGHEHGADSALTRQKQAGTEAEVVSVGDSAAPPPQSGIIDAFA